MLRCSLYVYGQGPHEVTLHGDKSNNALAFRSIILPI